MLWRMSADTHEQRIGVMGIFFSVILSEAKACPERSRRDLMPVASGDEILRCAQDDSGTAPQPATSVSATKVSLWLPATLIGVSLAEIAEIRRSPPAKMCVHPMAGYHGG
jgi:hypothetical protein